MKTFSCFCFEGLRDPLFFFPFFIFLFLIFHSSFLHFLHLLSVAHLIFLALILHFFYRLWDLILTYCFFNGKKEYYLEEERGWEGRRPRIVLKVALDSLSYRYHAFLIRTNVSFSIFIQQALPLWLLLRGFSTKCHSALANFPKMS